MIRRSTAIGLAAAALATGCGGGSEQKGGGPAFQPGQTGPAAAAPAGRTVGSLGDALIARPGRTQERGGKRRLTVRDALPPSVRRALGAEANCPDADVQPTPDNLPHVSDVIFCLMNAMRENNGLPDLAPEGELAKASVEHSQDMVDNHYFAHDSQDGRDIVARLKAVGYIPATGDWIVGENLAWGSGALSTPSSLVNAWMNSPPHRENLLSPDYKQVGMGVAYGTPNPNAPDGITVTTDFGTRLQDTGSAVASRARSRVRSATRRRLARCKRRHGAARRRCVRAARSRSR